MAAIQAFMAECFNFCNTFYCVRPGDNGANEHEESRSQTSSSITREERIKEVQDDAVVELMVTVDDAPVEDEREGLDEVEDGVEVMEVDDLLNKPVLTSWPKKQPKTCPGNYVHNTRNKKRPRVTGAHQAESESDYEAGETNIERPLKRAKTEVNSASCEGWLTLVDPVEMSTCDRGNVSSEKIARMHDTRPSWLRPFAPSQPARPRISSDGLFHFIIPSKSNGPSLQARVRTERLDFRTGRARARMQSRFAGMALRNPDAKEMKRVRLSGYPSRLRRWPAMYVDRQSGLFLQSGEFAYL